MTELSDAQFLGAPAHNAQEMTDDQFLGASSSAKPAAPAKAEPSATADVLKSGASGVAEGVYGLVGLPGDIGRAAEYGSNWLAGAAGHALGLTDKTGSEFAQQNMAALDKARGYKTLAPSSEDVSGAAAKIGIPDHTPETTAGQYAKTIGSFLPGAVAMPAEGLAGVAGNAVKYGLIPGALSEAAGQATQGTPVEPYARTIAGLTGGLGADAVTSGGNALNNARKAWWDPATGPEGEQDIAARTLRSGLTDPDAVKAKLQAEADAAAQNGTAIGQTSYGAKPQSVDIVSDPGLSGLARDVAEQDPAAFRSNEHGTGIDQQNAARAAALQSLQPTGAPEAIPALARKDLAGIQGEGDAKVAQAATAAEQAAPEAEAAVQAQAAAADAAHTANVGRARQVAEGQAGEIGTGAPAAELGAGARSAAQAGRDAATDAESDLWRAVDPKGDLNAVATPVSEAATDISGKINKLAKPRSAEEAAIFDAAQEMPDVAPLQDITTLRGRIAAAMRETIGVDRPAYRRLSMLHDATLDAINNAVEHQAAYEAAAVQDGSLAPEQTMMARVQKWADDFKAGKTAAPAAEPAALNDQSKLRSAYQDLKQESGGFDAVPIASLVERSGLPVARVHELLTEAGKAGDATLHNSNSVKGIFAPTAENKANWIYAKGHDDPFQTAALKDSFGSRQAAEDSPAAAKVAPTAKAAPVDPDAPLKPNMDEAAIARGKAANEATIKRVATYDKGPVGVMLRKMDSAGNYKQMDSAVPGILFRKGAKGGQTIQKYLDAAGPAGMARLSKIVAESFRSEVAPNGIADPKKFAAWSKNYGEALRMMPEELRSRFANAASATETLNDLEAQHGLLVKPLQGAAESLSREVMKDGVFDLRAFNRWQKTHAGTIAKMPQEAQDKLSTAAKASKAIEEAAAERKASVDAYKESVAGKFLGLEHPADVQAHVARILDSKTSVRDMTDLAKRVASDPDAKEGLRKALADEIVRRVTSTQEAGTSEAKALNAATLQKLIRDKAATIKAAGFSDQEVGLMHEMANDLERSQRTMSSSKLPNSPGTAQSVIKFMKNAKKADVSTAHTPSLLNNILGGAYLGFETGSFHGAMAGAAAGAGRVALERLVQARRNAGLARSADLVSEAVRNPEIMLALLKRTPKSIGDPSALRKALIRNSMFGATTIDRERNHGP